MSFWVLYSCTSFLIISPFMGSCMCRRGLSDPWSACFYCSCCVSVFLGLMCFLNTLMMMMMMNSNLNTRFDSRFDSNANGRFAGAYTNQYLLQIIQIFQECTESNESKQEQRNFNFFSEMNCHCVNCKYLTSSQSSSTHQYNRPVCRGSLQMTDWGMESCRHSWGEPGVHRGMICTMHL